MKIKEFEQALRGQEMSPTTIVQYSCAVSRFMREMGVRDTYTTEDVQHWLDSLPGITQVFKQSYYKALKCYFRLSGWDWNVKYPKTPKGYRASMPDLSPEHSRELLSLAKRESLRVPIPINLRNYAILCMLMDTGMRRGEISKLNRIDYDPPQLTIHMGKWQGDRTIIINPETITALNLSLETRQDSHPALFLGVDKRISPLTVGFIFRQYARRMGLPKGVGCHAARRGLATGLYEAGMTDREIMTLIGWRSSKTLDHYIRLSPLKEAAKAQKLHPVFGK